MYLKTGDKTVKELNTGGSLQTLCQVNTKY